MAMLPPTSFYWHDYETTGIDTARDRPLQFAGLRSDAELNEVGEPLVLYCHPPDDLLPEPEACLVTGITPQQARERGVCEAQFIHRIHAELVRPGTCGVGFNSLRFDDEITRHTLYRNLYDPYAREWRDGNSRWDLIDVARAAYALRPAGIEWPLRDDGTPSFRLEALTAANGLEHGTAHDALADVRGTLALARRLRERQPRLWEFLLGLRRKDAVWKLLDLRGMTPLVHVSGRYPAARGCLALVAPLARHRQNPNAVIVYDLSVDPAPLADLDSAEIAARVFSRAAELPAGSERIPLKLVRVNRCPVLAPQGVLRAADAERLGIDLGTCARHHATLRELTDIAARVEEVFAPPDGPPSSDPDDQLYSGPFLGATDRRRLEKIRQLPAAELGAALPPFDDPRLSEMVFRYRARNYPESLDEREREVWQAFRRGRLYDPALSRGRTLPRYFERLAALGEERGDDPRDGAILAALRAWGEELAAGLDDGTAG